MDRDGSRQFGRLAPRLSYRPRLLAFSSSQQYFFLGLRCTGCLECVAVCPAKDTLTMSVPAGRRKRRAIPAWSMAAGVAIIFFGLVGYAKLTGHWNTDLPKQVYLQLVPNAREQQHPMPWAQ